MQRPSLQHGVTLVELLVTLVILSILVGVAMPNFFKMIGNNRAESQASQLLRSFNYARGEAIRRNNEVHITSINGLSWSSGWRIWVDNNANNVFDAGDVELQVEAPFAGTDTLTNATLSELVFSGSGFLRKEAGFTPATELTFSYRVDSRCDLGQDVAVSYAGRVTMNKQVCP